MSEKCQKACKKVEIEIVTATKPVPYILKKYICDAFKGKESGLESSGFRI